MRDILLKSTILTVLALFFSVPAAADWQTDPAAEDMWSSGITLNNVDLGTSYQIEVLDPIPYGSNWAYGYDRISTVKALNPKIRPYTIYRNVYDNESGNCYWNYLDEDILTLPPGLQYTLVHEVVDGAGTVLCHDEAIVTTIEGDPLPPTWSSSYSVDTYNIASGKTIEVKPTDYLTYSAKWAYNAQEFDKKITLYAVDQGENSVLSFFSSTSASGDTYTIMTSGVNAEGSYQWNYESVDPGVLPRGDTYTLNYTIFDNDDPTKVYQSATGVTTITITPEPSLALLALLALGLSFRKLN